MSTQLSELRVVIAHTDGEYAHLGEWVAQIKGLPQARAYGASDVAALGKLILAFGKEHGITMLPPAELDLQRA